jgi:toxin ParE1/3/4
MARLTIRPLAEQDLDDIWDYIATSNLEQAEKTLRQLYAKMGTLAHNPYIGRERQELQEGLRSFPAGNYVIFYSTLPDGIEIIRVLHGSRNIQEIFES